MSDIAGGMSANDLEIGIVVIAFVGIAIIGAVVVFDPLPNIANQIVNPIRAGPLWESAYRRQFGFLSG